MAGSIPASRIAASPLWRMTDPASVGETFVLPRRSNSAMAAGRSMTARTSANSSASKNHSFFGWAVAICRPSSRIGRARSSAPSSSQRSATWPRSLSFVSGVTAWRASARARSRRLSRRVRSRAGRNSSRASQPAALQPGSRSSSMVALATAGSSSNCARTTWIKVLDGSATVRFSIISSTRAGSTRARVMIIEPPALPSEPDLSSVSNGSRNSLARARSSALGRGDGSVFKAANGGSLARSRRISTGSAPLPTVAPPKRNPGASAKTRAGPPETPCRRKRPSASVLADVHFGPSPAFETVAPGTGFPSRSTTRPKTTRTPRDRLRVRSGSVRRSSSATATQAVRAGRNPSAATSTRNSLGFRSSTFGVWNEPSMAVLISGLSPK